MKYEELFLRKNRPHFNKHYVELVSSIKDEQIKELFLCLLGEIDTLRNQIQEIYEYNESKRLEDWSNQR